MCFKNVKQFIFLLFVLYREYSGYLSLTVCFTICITTHDTMSRIRADRADRTQRRALPRHQSEEMET